MSTFTESLRNLGFDHGAGTLTTEALLGRVCELVQAHLRCSRVSIWEFGRRDAGRVLACLAACATDGASSPVGNVLDESSYGGYFAALASNGMLHADDAWTDPRLDGLLETYLRPQAVRSMLDVAFSVNGSVFGVLCCEQIGTLRAWQPRDVAAIRRTGSLLSLALSRHGTDPFAAITAWGDSMPQGLPVADQASVPRD